MNEAYGCKSGYGTLVQAMELIFYAHIDNFGAFGDRTIFAKVIRDDKWTALRDKVVAWTGEL